MSDFEQAVMDALCQEKTSHPRSVSSSTTTKGVTNLTSTEEMDPQAPLETASKAHFASCMDRQNENMCCFVHFIL